VFSVRMASDPGAGLFRFSVSAREEEEAEIESKSVGHGGLVVGR